MITTVLVDDHKLFCDGLEKLLNDSGQFHVIRKFHTGLSLLENIERLAPEMLLLDVEMPGVTGLDVVKSIRTQNATMKIVVISMHEESVYSREANACGANGYLVKSIESSVLIDTLLEIYNGARIFSKSRVSILNEGKILSAQEMKILNLIALGKSSKDIADALSISDLTVKTHRRNIIKKLKASNSAELIKIAHEKGFL